MMTAPDPLRGNAHLVDALGSALRSGEHGLSTVPGLLERVLTEGSWRKFITKRGEQVEHERFADFVTTPPLAGLGTTVEMLQRIIGDRVELVDRLDELMRNPVGHPGKGNNVTRSKRPGNTREQALRRLRKDAPELHAEVLAGRLTAHAAAVQAGFRPRTFTVRMDSPESIANSLRRQLDPEMLAKLVQLLGGA
jgi:hypothetical protein